MSDANDTILGIDLGTTLSLAAVAGAGDPRVIGALVPSVVAILADGSVLVGDNAKALAFDHPERVVHSVKRLIGRSSSEVRVEAARLAYPVVAGDSGQVRVRIALEAATKDFSPEELASLILREVVARARRELGDETINRVVLTVPAYFDEAQRQATKRAAELAGLDVVRLVNEPTAASLAYGVGRKNDATVLVYDLGGGTFDVSILKIQAGVFRVLSTHGDTQLGGDDFDRRILDLVFAKIHEATGAELGDDPRILATLRSSAEGLKIRLSESETAELEIDIGSEKLSIVLTRSDFESMIAPELDRTIDSVRHALRDARLGAGDIEDVVLVGGSTRIPAVRERLAAFFGRTPHTDVDPDLAVALGAAIQGGVLAGTSGTDILLLDVVPLSLGIETLGGAFSKLILRNSTVPCSVTEEFSTQVDNQTGIDLNIFQGERELVRDCRRIGAFKLTGIPAMPAGLPRVAVTFTVDTQGLLRVTARELRSGQTASIEVVPSLGLSEDDVSRMVSESIENAGRDVNDRETLELRNKAAAVVRGTEAALARGGDGLAPEQAYSIKKALANVKNLLDSDDAPALNMALDSLSSMTMQLADDLIGAAVRNAMKSAG